MLRLNFFRNFSKSSTFWLRQQVISDQEPPIIPKIKDETPKKEEEPKHEVKIIKLRKNDKELAQLMTMLKTKKKKDKMKQIIVEGNQLIREAVQEKLKLNKLIFSETSKIKDVLEVLGRSTAGIDFIKVPMPDLTHYSVLQTCPGLIAIFDRPQVPEVKFDAHNIDVIADNVREPTNLGALIRISNALPVARMLLPKGSADPWETKCIRGSAGSIFHLPVESGLYWDEIAEREDKDALVLIADNNIKYYNHTKVVNYDKIPPELLKRKVTLIIGGETEGISKDALYYAKERDYRVVNIPIDSTVNSLNVATALGIILFELRRVLLN